MVLVNTSFRTADIRVEGRIELRHTWLRRVGSKYAFSSGGRGQTGSGSRRLRRSHTASVGRKSRALQLSPIGI
jgi:hypothetical protein